MHRSEVSCERALHAVDSRDQDEWPVLVQESKATGLIVDLRDDPGGGVEAVLDTAQLLLPGDELFITLVNREGSTQAVQVPQHRPGWAQQQPMVCPLCK